MSADTCFWCHSPEPIALDAEGDGYCAGCAPLLDEETTCACGATPVKMRRGAPMCVHCLVAHPESTPELPEQDDEVDPVASLEASLELVNDARAIGMAPVRALRIGRAAGMGGGR